VVPSAGDFGHGLGADHAACADPIVHDDRLAPALIQFLGDRARDDVGSAARGKGNDDADGLCRIGLRENLRGVREQRGQAQQGFGQFHRGAGAQKLVQAGIIV